MKSRIFKFLTEFWALLNFVVIARGEKPRDPGKFDLTDYQGDIPRGILAVYKGDGKLCCEKLRCYGILVNWQVGMVPCSCVYGEQADYNLANMWNHYRRNRVRADDPKDYSVVTMWDEYPHEVPPLTKRYRSQVDQIQLSPKCDTSFVTNVARITLKQKILGSKLAWIARPNENLMKNLLIWSFIGKATKGVCFVYRWVDTVQEDWRKRISTPGRGPNPPKPKPKPKPPKLLKRFLINTEPWMACFDNVCPLDRRAPFGEKVQWDLRICINSDDLQNRSAVRKERSRFCLSWDYKEEKICTLAPGTPVFCQIGELSGVAGFLHDSPFNCPHKFSYNHRVMEGIDSALHLINYDMRAINAYHN